LTWQHVSWLNPVCLRGGTEDQGPTRSFPRLASVVMDSCEQCGFAYASLTPSDIPSQIRAFPSRYSQALSDVPLPVARQRPEAGVWSALEYACHVRDVLLVQRDRAVLTLVELRPSFARMYRDERVELCHYARHEVAEVLAQLDMAAKLCAMVFDGLERESWSRPLIYNFPGPAERDLAWLGRHTVHEASHHLGDLRRVLGLVS
jgi:hypothetical protein